MYFLYLPGAQGADPKLLDDVGLASVNIGWSHVPVLGNGPDGGQGVFCFCGNTDGPRGVHLDSQEWKPEQGQDPPRYWVGWVKGAKPGPADLARKKQHPGTAVTLCDGNEWLIPLARQLPHVNGIKPGGGFKRKLKHEYQAFWDLSQVIHDSLLKNFMVNECQRWEWNQFECWPFSCAALAQNYLLTPEIIDALELLEDDSHFEIAEACTELSAAAEALWHAVQKKRTQAPAT